jgi:hypothetical protein
MAILVEVVVVVVVVVVPTTTGKTKADDGGVVGRLAMAGDIVVVNAEAYDEARRGRRRDDAYIVLYIRFLW